DPEQFRPLIDYLAMMLTDESGHGRAVFELLLAETRAMLDAGVADGTMRPSSDPEARALLVTLHGVAPVILRGHLERAPGGDILPSAVLARLTLPSPELYTQRPYSHSTALDAARAALGTPKEQPCPTPPSASAPSRSVTDRTPPCAASTSTCRPAPSTA